MMAPFSRTARAGIIIEVEEWRIVGEREDIV